MIKFDARIRHTRGAVEQTVLAAVMMIADDAAI